MTSTAVADLAGLRSVPTKATPRAIGGAANWLGLAAAPVFAVMALIIGVSGSGQPEMLCPAMHGGSMFDGMIPMYLLMSVFHAAPWLKLITRARLDANESGEDRRPA